MDYNITYNFEFMCRTCLAYNVELNSMYDDNIANVLSLCQFLHISSDDGLPNKICIPCKTLVLKSYNFKQQCQESQEKLKKCLTNYNDNVVNKILDTETISNDNWKHNVTETLELKCYKCHQCQQSFPCESAFLLHKDLHHQDDNFLCPYCMNKIVGSQLFIKHFQECGNKDNSNQASIDSKKNFSDNESESEDKTEIGNDLTSFLYNEPPSPLPFPCNECSQSFTVEHDLKLHESTHIKTGDYVCSSCKKQFGNRQMLKRHVKTHMLHKPHVCQLCNKGFAESHALTKHVRRHNGQPREKRHFCTVCGQGFSEPFYLNVHMRKHTGERPLICSTCGKSFADPRSLKAHNMIHTGERPYKCHICEKAFSQNVNLTKHIRVHTGEKPYICAECGKRFTQSSTLDKHSRTHSGYKPYACTHCPKRFAEKGTLIHHVRTHTGEKPYVCEHCGKAFASSSELKLHDRKHSGVKKNICNVCGKDFATPSNLRVHLRTHSGEKPFSCEHCTKHFADKGSLKKHLKIHTEKNKQEIFINTIDLNNVQSIGNLSPLQETPQFHSESGDKLYLI